MIKKIITVGLLGLYLCTPSIKAEDTRPNQAPSCEIQSTDQNANESTHKSEPVHVRYTAAPSFNDRLIQFLIAVSVDLAFMVYEKSTTQDVVR
jgi:hypothetical protein